MFKKTCRGCKHLKGRMCVLEGCKMYVDNSACEDYEEEKNKECNKCIYCYHHQNRYFCMKREKKEVTQTLCCGFFKRSKYEARLDNRITTPRERV